MQLDSILLKSAAWTIVESERAHSGSTEQTSESGIPMDNLPRAIVIGSAATAAAMENLRPDWIFADTVESVREFRAGLSRGDISNELQIVLITDGLFDPTGEDDSFEKLSAQLSPYCLFGVISYDPELRGKIVGRIEETRYNGSHPRGGVYFVDHAAPRRSLDEAVSSFLKDASSESSESVRFAAEVLSSQQLVSH